jgi:hypothetical protein
MRLSIREVSADNSSVTVGHTMPERGYVMRGKSLKRTIALATALIVALLGMPILDAQAGEYFLWNVVLQGESQGVSFQRQASVAITTPIDPSGSTNGANPFEVLIVSGDPGANPESGAIWFSTNSALLGGQAQVDMAYVDFDPNQSLLYVRPDPSLSAVGINVFNAYSGVTADVYQIFDGAIYLWSQDGFTTIEGWIDILGTGAIFHSNTSYRAYFSGSFAGSGSF